MAYVISEPVASPSKKYLLFICMLGTVLRKGLGTKWEAKLSVTVPQGCIYSNLVEKTNTKINV